MTDAAEANIVPPPTATKLILDLQVTRQIRHMLTDMRKTWDDIESGDVTVSIVEQSPDPRTFALVLRCKDEPPARLVNPGDFR